jgi:gluconolactonase
MKYFFTVLSLIYILGCKNHSSDKKEKSMNNTVGTIERLDSSLNTILSANAKIEIIADGFDWSEGPLWVEKYKMLLFSDIPPNTIYKWTEEKGKEVYLTPSGYTDTVKRKGEIGSNGLILDKDGNLVMCQHGDRRMARMDAPLDNPAPKFITLADKYNGKRLSSPNDAVYNSNGELFFTDPPYGLETQDDKDPKKELPFNGVYKVKTNGELILLVDSITRPNGLAFLPGEKKLIVACSDPKKPYWYIYDVNGDSLTNGKIFYDASTEASKRVKGLPDGLKIDKNGNVFATGPGGVYIFNSEGKKLGIIKFDESTSNCAFSADEKTLYVTNDMNVVRVKMRE